MPVKEGHAYQPEVKVTRSRVFDFMAGMKIGFCRRLLLAIASDGI